jgi:CHRD domain
MQHRRTIAALIGLVTLVMMLALAPTAQAIQRFTTTLEGENEVPTTGDTDGTGTAMITVNRGTLEVCWEIQVTGIALPATAAHIHVGSVGVPGGVVVGLSAPDATGFASGCTTAVSRELAKDIAKNPENYYVSVHNAEFPDGALRGQLG